MMMMDEQNVRLGLCVLKVFFLAVIAYSAWVISCRAKSGFGNNSLLGSTYTTEGSIGWAGANGARALTETQQSMFNNAEPPVFWNLGDAEAINAELQSAARPVQKSAFSDDELLAKSQGRA